METENKGKLKCAGVVLVLVVLACVYLASATTVITDIQVIMGNVTVGPDEIQAGTTKIGEESIKTDSINTTAYYGNRSGLAGIEIKQLIQDFVVESGESITAGDSQYWNSNFNNLINNDIINYSEVDDAGFDVVNPTEGIENANSVNTKAIEGFNDQEEVIVFNGEIGFVQDSKEDSKDSGPDLKGYDGNPSYAYDVQENNVYWGDLIHMQFAVANFGDSAAGPFKVKIYVSDNNNIDDGSDHLIRTITFTSGLGSMTYNGYSNHGLPVTLPSCNPIDGSSPYYIGMVVDADNEVAESNEGNNKNQGYNIDYDSLTILEPLPDLVGYGGNPDYAFNITEDAAYWGGQVNLKFAVLNQQGSAGPFKIKLFLSDNNNIDDGNDYMIREINNPGLECGHYTMYSSAITLPSTDPISGSTPYYIGMVVDADNQVVESDEGNNKNEGMQIDYDSFTTLVPEPDIQVFDSVGDDSDLALDFGDVVDDGAGNSQATHTVTLVNNGKATLTVSQNGIYLTNGTQFQIDSILSSTQDLIDLSYSPVAISANGKESWVVTLIFDPADPGVQNDVLTIVSDDPDEGTVTVSIQGTGVPTPDIVISEVDQALDFDQVPNDGPLGLASTKSITLQNSGSGPLTINQSGISLNSGTNFGITSIMSDTQGIIDLSSSSATIQEERTETWTIEILCDPIEDGPLTDALTIASDDPDEQTVTITLSAFGLTAQDIAVNTTLIDFGGVHADGSGNQLGIDTVTITNYGEASLNISSNGIYLNSGTVYELTEIISDVQGQINISKTNSIAGNLTETWTITLQFDPDTSGQATDTLTIISNDPDETPFNVPITGTGLNEADIEVTDVIPPDDDLNVDFYPTLNDGAGNRISEQTITLKNIGTQSLTVSQISVGASNGYSVASINSSISGAVSLPDTIDPVSAEEWEVRVSFDPADNGNLNDILQIQNNDPDEGTVSITLVGVAVQPGISLIEPAVELGVNAQQMYGISWDDDYTGGDALISLYLDPDTDPNNSNEILIVSNLSEDNDQNSYSWYVPSDLVGNEYYIYSIISDSIITDSSYSPGTLLVEPTDAFRLLSPLHTSQNEYNYQYEYNSQIYSGIRTLTTGKNQIVVENDDGNGGTIKHEFYVTFYESTIDSGQYTYDEMNRVKTYTNGNGEVTNYIYDKPGRLERLEYSSGAVVEYTYDITGNPLSVHDASGYIFYTYDDLDRVTSVVYSEDAISGSVDDRAISYDYDLTSRLIEIVYPSGGNVEYVYDNANRLSEVKDYTSGNLKTTTYSYNVTTGLLNQIIRPNNVKSVYTYDGSARLSDIEHRDAADTLISKYHYEYDVDSRRTELWVTTSLETRKEKYTYDDLEQIIEVIYSDDATFDANDKNVNYTYDGNGNRLSMMEIVNQEVQEDYRYYYGHENRLLQMDERLSENSTKFYYDPAGNRIMKVTDNETVQYSYDERNLLTRVITSTQNIEFEYDAVGNRIAKNVNGVRTEYTIDSLQPVSQVIEEYDGSDQLIAHYTYGGSRISGMLPGESDPTYYLADGLGSVRRLVDESGTVSDEYLYDVFGSVGFAPISTNEYLFTGERFDSESGLIYLRARYYDPEVGGFITKDPLGVSGGMNSYVYLENDPVNNVDPNGLFNIIVGVEGEFIANRDPEKHINDLQGQVGFGIALNPGVGESKADLGLYGVVAKGGGLHGGGSIYVGIIRGQSVAGNANSLNFDFVVFGVSVKLDKETNRFEGLTIGRGPSAGFSATESITGDATIREGFDWIQNLNRNPDLEPYTLSPDFDSSQLIDDIMSYDFRKSDGSLAGGMAAELMGYSPAPDPGGVLIDKAAVLIGSNLSDIRGATYDPESGQIIFLGSDDPAAVKDIDMDYFFTAVQAVYGSAVPPFVTLDPPASMYSQWVDLGDGDGIFEPDELGGFILYYSPIWNDPEDDLRVRFDMSWEGTPTTFTANIDSFESNNIIACGRKLMALTLSNWTDKPAEIVLADNLAGGIILPGMNQEDGFRLTQLHAGCEGQYNYYRFFLQNNGSQNYFMDSVRVIPNKQHRKYGGRVEGSKLGWVMYEADRVMKCLAVGVDNVVPDKTYNSSNVPISGFQNMAERLQAGGEGGNVRMWFVPDEMTLKRHVDEETGQATIVFNEASVALKTESKMRGLPQPPIARDFADHFNEHYDEFAAMNFPVMDPDDPTGENIIEVPIFEMLREGMQGVALARFFRDNDIPLDMWWLNTWEPPTAYSPKTIPTAYNEEGDILIFGGVEVNKPNDYVPSADAQSIGDLVKSQRPGAQAGSDIAGQDWGVTGTSQGDLTAVAASMEATQQNSNIHLTEIDLSFDSPGSLTLAFGRYYTSSYLGKNGMGAGWRIVPLSLEFSRPSWYDEHGLMKNENNEIIWSDGTSDTCLHAGAIRFINHATGRVLNFYSSLNIYYDVDGLGNPIIAVDGLNENDLPTFTPGEWQDGSTLEQITEDHGYVLTLPDRSTVAFDDTGKLLNITDKHNYHLIYNYNSNETLKEIVDEEGQRINIAYNADGKVHSVTGPYSEEITYDYDTNGRLFTVTNSRSYATTTYSYNEDNQLLSVTPYDGVTHLTTTPDLRGRSDERLDKYGNNFNYNFELDSSDLSHTTAIEDTGSLSQATWTKTFDSEGRLTGTNDPLGNGYEYDYYTDSQYPNSVKLPIADRASINVDRNAYGQPTRITDPELLAIGAKEIDIVYDNETNLPLQVNDSKGRVTEYTYSDNNDLIKVTRYLNGQPVETNFTYQNGYLHTITDPSGEVVQIINHDNLGRVSDITDAAGITTSYTYDSLGRLWKITNPRLSSPIEYAYNDFDQIIQIRTPSGTTVYDYYPGTQWLKSITSPDGNIQEYIYDSQTGDLIKTKQIVYGGDDVEVGYSYNRVGQFAGLTMPEGQEVSFEYDDLRRVTGASNSDYNTFVLTQPDGINDVANENFIIRWVDEDTDHSSLISLYYDTDDQGEDGTLIISGISEDDEMDSCEWDTSGIAEGDYYVYAIVDDGVNPPVTNYSSGTVTINHTAAPSELNCICGDICINTTGWWRDGSNFNATVTPLQAAVENATAGENVCVKNGIYINNVDVNKRLTIYSQNGSASTTIQAANPIDHVFEVTANWVNISGFNVTGATGSEMAGIYLNSSDNCRINENTVTNNDYGVYLKYSSDNTIYNNYLINTQNAYDDSTNIWNTTNTTGPNIVGGLYIGGNYWGDYTGTDASGDGFGDAPYNIPGGLNQDHLPLVPWCGNLDGNMTIDTADLQLLLAHIFAGTSVADECICDVDGSGHVNILDARLLMKHIADPENYPLNCTC